MQSTSKVEFMQVELGDLHSASRVTLGQVTTFVLGAYWDGVPWVSLGVKSLGFDAIFVKKCKVFVICGCGACM